MASGPTPLNTQEAKVAVELFGSQRSAAKALGVPRSTLRYWLNPEADNARYRARYHADPEKFRERMREQYHNEDFFQRSRRQLRNRRTHALIRMAKLGREENPNG